MKHLSLLLLGVLLLDLGALVRGESVNLLPLPAPSTVGQNPATDWVFSAWNLADDPTAKGKVEGKVAVDTDGRNMLTVASTESLKAMQMWWQAQGIACAGGSSYQLSVLVKGTVKTGTARPTIGLYFMDADKKWIGFSSLSGTPDSMPTDWQKVEGKIAVPENAVTMGVRIGVVYSEGDADVSFKDPSLTPAAH